MTTRIFIPLSPCGGVRGDDTELRYTLRSIAAHWQGALPEITIFGRLPAWAQGIAQVPAGSLQDAIAAAAQHAGSDRFLWWYDDCLLLKDSSEADVALPRRAGNLASALSANRSSGRWRQALATVTEELLKAGRTTHNFSGPHAPIFYTGADFTNALEYWRERWVRKLPFESWTNNDGRPHRDASDVETRFARETTFRAPLASARLLIPTDRSITPLFPWMEKRFPTVSPWENPEQPVVQPKSKKALYEEYAQNLFLAWKDQGSPALRTICEVAVGPWSLMAPFQGHCEKAIFVEPDPKMAATARVNYPWATVHQVAIAEDFGAANLRNLKGASYITGLPWAPAHDYIPARAKRAAKTRVATVPFHTLDDGRIDAINLDCEGSEWFVLSRMFSRPKFLQIELYPRHAHRAQILDWLAANGYTELRRWGHDLANIIFIRS